MARSSPGARGGRCLRTPDAAPSESPRRGALRIRRRERLHEWSSSARLASSCVAVVAGPLASRSLVADAASPPCRSGAGMPPPTFPSQLALHCGRRIGDSLRSPTERSRSIVVMERSSIRMCRDCFVAWLLAMTVSVIATSEAISILPPPRRPDWNQAGDGGDPRSRAPQPRLLPATTRVPRVGHVVSSAPRCCTSGTTHWVHRRQESVRYRATFTTAAPELADRSLGVHS